MDQSQLLTLAKMGAVASLGLAAVGSALGCGTAGMAAIGAWKKAYLKGKNALFTLLIFVDYSGVKKPPFRNGGNRQTGTLETALAA